MLQQFFRWNRAISKGFDRLLPIRASLDGNRDFVENIAPRGLRHGHTLVDVGGGRHPYVDPETKLRLGMQVVGVDIDGHELAAAPAGSYDRCIICDIAELRGDEFADVVICQAVLEHVRRTDAAIAAIASILRPGGYALLFMPSRNALFARLNLLLPEAVKTRLLHAIYPESIGKQGFRSFYRDCTPERFTLLAARANLQVEELHLYWSSAYFTFLFPLHLCWRVVQGLMWFVLRDQAAETFAMVLRKPERGESTSRA